MGLHIEIDGGASLREWTAVGVIALFMCGQEAAAAQLAGQLAPSALGAPPSAKPADAKPAVVVTGAPATPADLAEALIAAQERKVAAAPTVGGEALPPDEGEDELPTVPLAERPGAAVPLDSAGLPHDIRIHAATKTTNKDGTWRYLRGVDKDLVAQVEAELKQIMAAPVPEVSAAPVPPPPSGQEGPVVTDPAAAFGGPGNAPAVPAPPATTATIPPPPATSGPAVTPPASPSNDTSGTADAGGAAEFARIMRVVVEKQKAGMSTETTTQIAQQLGITSVRDLVKRPDLIPAFEALLP